MKKINETLLDLIFGCLIYSGIFEVIGLIAVENKLSFSLGILLGTVVAIFMAVTMNMGLEQCLSMEASAAGRRMVLWSFLRTAVILAVGFFTLRCRYVSFAGAMVGIIGLKMSAHFHMYTNVYITQKIIKKGR